MVTVWRDERNGGNSAEPVGMKEKSTGLRLDQFSKCKVLCVRVRVRVSVGEGAKVLGQCGSVA